MYLSCCAKLPLRVAVPPGMPRSSAVNSPPTGGAVELSLGPRPHKLLKLSAGESSVECRSLNTLYRRNSGPKRTSWFPFSQVKFPVNVWLSEEATPSPDSEALRVVSDPTLIFGTGVLPPEHKPPTTGAEPDETGE